MKKTSNFKKNRFLPSMAALALIGTGALVYTGVASASTTTSSAYTTIASTTSQRWHGGGHGTGKGSGVSGTVTAVNGTTITTTGVNSTTYTVDASSAKISKISSIASGTASTTRPSLTTITVSEIAVGDTVMVRGTVSGTSVTATTIIDGKFNGEHGMGSGTTAKTPGVSGTVTAVNGDSITLTGKKSTVYTVDAANAKIEKITAPAAGTVDTGTSATASSAWTRPTPTTITVSEISVGDTLMVQGTVSGTSVTATTIIDGKFDGFRGHSTATHAGTITPRVAGTITAINGDSMTITYTPKTGAPVTYTVDISNAKITERGAKGTTPATIEASALVVGDKVGVKGTVSGTSVTATSVTLRMPTTTAASTATTTQ